MTNTNQAQMIKEMLEATIRAVFYCMEKEGYVSHNNASAIHDLVSVLGEYNSHGDLDTELRSMLSDMLNSTINYAHHQTTILGNVQNPDIISSIKLLMEPVKLLG